MSSASLTSAPTATARLVVDTDVASSVFKWHPKFAPRYVGILRGLEADFSVLHSDGLLCSTWAAVRNESGRKGHQVSSADAWIAATALVLPAPLVTNNPKDYRHLDRLQLLSAAGE